MKEQKQKEKKRSKKGPSIMKDMDQILSDPRFAHVSSDLKLRHVPKEERKVKLDSRFYSVLTDDKFYEKSIMDPRGRKGNYSTKEDLLKFYRMSSDDDTDDEEEEDVTDEDEDSDDKADGKPDEVGEAVGVENNLEVCGIVTAEFNEDKEIVAARRKESEVLLDKDNIDEKEYENRLRKEKMKEREAREKLEIPEEVREQLQDMTQDYARGEMLFSDDSSDDDSTTTDEDEDDGEFEWGELDQDAVWDDGKHEVEETSRFAVCNLDWDRIKAADIMVLFTSFCPRGASIKRVTIYPSEYGKQRMAEEDLSGPQELKTKSSHEANNDDIDLINLDKLEKGMLDESTGATKANYEALRRYQRNRLRYYYAVVECDSVDTARILYQECDRQPYEGAGILLDLRYIPSDMSFDETPYDICETVQKSYEVKSFTTTALHDSRPVLTWDETDPERQKILSTAMTKAMKGEELDEDYLKDFLASSSEDGSSSEDDESNSDDEETKSSQIAKFRALISEIDEKERKKKERDIDMEETFHLEEDDTTDEPKPKDKEDTKETAQLNPFEKYLEKRKAKRKDKEKMKKKELNNTKNDSEQERELNSAISDDELPEDIDGLYSDPFFAEEMKKMNKAKSNQREGKTKKDSSEDEVAEGNVQGNLELLLMNEDDEDKKHFSMREIIEKNKEKRKRRKNKAQKKNQEKQEQQVIADDFKVDVTDPRFIQLLTSGEYNIDPSHPQFKRTKAMDHLIDSVQMKRIAESFEDIPDAKRQNKSVEKSKDHELSLLVKRVKKKANKPKKH